MRVTSYEIGEALGSTVRKHRLKELSQTLACSVASKAEEKIAPGKPFGEVIRYTLNELHIWDKDARTVWASYLGFLFGKRAREKQAKLRLQKNKASAAVRGGAKTKRSPRPSEIGKIIVGKGGQLAFKI